MNYLEYGIRIANLLPVNVSSTQFQNMLPAMIDTAEQRIYRELNLLSTVVTNSTSSTTAGNRNFTLPSSTGKFVTVITINIITPASTAPDSGTRNQLTPVDRTYLDAVWNSSTGATVPKHFAMNDQDTILFGPWPNAAYRVEVVGTIRPTSLSATNTTTFLTLYLPDLFIAASMVFAGENMRDFGAEGNNPNVAQIWEGNYQALMQSANAEELRKKFSGPGWTSMSNVANPPNR
jgi:hypothetical protein